MFAQEQTHESIPIIGPTAAFSINRNQVGPLSTNKAFHQFTGTTADTKPATRNPATNSSQIIRQSATNALAIRFNRLVFSKPFSSCPQQWPVISTAFSACRL